MLAPTQARFTEQAGPGLSFHCLPVRIIADKLEDDISPDAVFSTDDGSTLFVQESDDPGRRVVTVLPDHLKVVDVYLVESINTLVVADADTADELIGLQEAVLHAMERIRELLQS